MIGRVYSVVNQEWALHRGFKPCSTIKLVTGVAGLSEKIIPPVETASEGFRLDLTSALAHSNNPYFEQVGSHLGFDRMVTYAKEMGLGEKTGIKHGWLGHDTTFTAGENRLTDVIIRIRNRDRMPCAVREWSIEDDITSVQGDHIYWLRGTAEIAKDLTDGSIGHPSCSVVENE